MGSTFIEFDEVDDFSPLAVGPPGSRTFYINTRSGGQNVNVRCEKQQVQAIAKHLRNVLDDLPPPEHRVFNPSTDAAPAQESAFVLGPVGLGYDRLNDRLVVQLEELLQSDLRAAQHEDDNSDLTDHDIDRGRVRLYISRSQADAFCRHAERIVGAGRQRCQFCGHPIDPDGHACPRMN
jgi:uncharacterized repeat protein (TIGR03847 family)